MMRRSTSTLGIILALAFSVANAQTVPFGGGSSPGRGRKAKLPLVDELKQTYRLTRLAMGADGQPTVIYGAAFLVKQQGIMGLPWANLGVAVANFENGALHQPGAMDRMFAANNALWFQPGDHVFADKFDVDTKRDRITFTLVTQDYTYKAGLHFKFGKGFLAKAVAGEIYDVIGQVIAFEDGSNAPQTQSQQQYTPAPPPPPAAPVPPPAPADQASYAPLLFNGQVVGYGPAGAVLLPPDQPPASADGRAWVPVVRNGQIVAYAPPGSTIWPQADSPNSAPAASAPRTITLGQSGEEVQAILGTPDKIANLGSKVIFIYKDLKVTLTDGKVTDVQ